MKKITTIDKRKEFLMKHEEVDVLLINLQYKRTKGYSVDNYNYSFYKEYINDLYSVEKYYNELLNLSFIFIRELVYPNTFGSGSSLQSTNQALASIGCFFVFISSLIIFLTKVFNSFKVIFFFVFHFLIYF